MREKNDLLTLDGSAAEKEGISIPSHPMTSPWRSDRSALHEGRQGAEAEPMSVVGEARALGCGGVEDLHRDLLHTLLHGASRERGGLSAAHRAQGAEDTGSDGCAGTGLEAARPEVGCR